MLFCAPIRSEQHYHTIFPDKLQVKVQLTLQPDIALEAAADFRHAKEIFCIYTHIKIHVVAFERHLINVFIGDHILYALTVLDISKNLILFTFHSIRHEKRIHNRKYILLINSPRHH